MFQGTKQNLISIGNETFDKFLGGGFLNSSINLFERQGPSSRILEAIWNKSFASATLVKKNAIIFLNLNSGVELDESLLLHSLPTIRKVKSNLLYKDVRGKSATAQIKIAWRYSNRGLSSPSDALARMELADFGIPLLKDYPNESIGKVRIINVKEDTPTDHIIANLAAEVFELKKDFECINIIVKDLLHPLDTVEDEHKCFFHFIYGLRCIGRILDKGAILVSFDTNMCKDHAVIKEQLYNLVDCVVSFYSYESGENILTGYKDIDGTLEYVKVPKIRSFGFHFQQDLSDWGYRLTKNHRFFVIDELSLPPCDDDDGQERVKKKDASDLANIAYTCNSLEQVGPLEEFRMVATDILAKKL